MEVIHRFNGAYPFDLERETEKTYLEVVKDGLSAEQIATERAKLKVLREMEQHNFLKVVRVYREEATLHLLFEYFPLSLEGYVRHRSLTVPAEKTQGRALYAQFVQALNGIADALAQAQIKTDISINNIAVSNFEEGELKIFIDPNAEFHGLEGQSHQFNSKVETINQIQALLQDFYNHEKKRLVMEFEEWLEKYFGRSYSTTEQNHPNFVISGSKLVFINQPNSKHEPHRNQNMLDISPEREPKVQPRNVLRNSPRKMEKTDEIKRGIKEKNMKKIEEIKNVLNRIESKTPNFSHQSEQRLTPHKAHNEEHSPYIPHHTEVRQNSALSHEKIRVERPVAHGHETINAQQSPPHLFQHQNVDSIVFKSGEIAEKARRLVESDQEHKKSADARHTREEHHANKVKRVSTLKDDEPTPEQEKPDSSSRIELKNPQAKTDEAHREGGKTEPKKEDRHNKYIMKITTSHEFEIQGTGEPQIKEIEKDILEGIKSGRIALSEFPDKANNYKIETTEIHQVAEAEKDRANTDSESPLLNAKTSEISLKPKKMSELPHSNGSSHQAASTAHHEQKNYDDYSSENFSEKIREAKSKAEQVLKEYAKKKQ